MNEAHDTPAREAHLRRRCALAACGGALGSLAYPPLPAWWLAPVGLALVVVALDGARGWREAMLVSLAHGLVFYSISLRWLATVHWAVPVLVLLLQLFHSSYQGPVVARALARWPRVPRAVIFPLAWMACEVARGLGPYGFPWFRPALALPGELSIVQEAELIGANGLSLVVYALAGAIVDLGRRRWVGLVVVLLIVAAGSWHGAHLRERAEDALSPGPRVLVVQANISQELRNELEPGTSWQEATLERPDLEVLFTRHMRLSLAELASSPEIVVWGETMYPQDLSSRRNSRDTERVRDLVEAMEASFLIGGFRIEPPAKKGEDARIFNTAFYFTPQAPAGLCHLEDAGHKRQLVPGGEWVPFHSLPGVKALARKITGADLPDLVRGDQPIRLMLTTRAGERIPFGVFICYETFFPSILAELVAPDEESPGWPGAEFLITLSNEGWFGTSAELDQHLAAARLRAIEARRSIVRATNTGITALVDPLGRVRRRLVDSHGSDREVEGSLLVEPPRSSQRPSALQAAWIIEMLLLVAALALVFLPIRRSQAVSGHPAV